MAKKKTAPKKRSPRITATKKKVNRSQLIRDYLAANPDDNVKAIVAAFAKKGIKISEALAANVKYKKQSPKKKATRKQAATKQPVVNDKISISTLVKAKRMAEELGGMDKAKQALAALAKLQ